MSSFLQPGTVILATTALLVLLTIVTLLHRKKFSHAEKKLFFALISIPVLLATIYVAGYTIYENVHSATGGPIHWHLDYQVWSCGERLDLINPRFPSNKIGTPLLHEHNDDRLHVEGTINHLEDVDLGSFFTVLGGKLTSTSLVYPTREGIVEVSNGAMCGSETGTLKVFANGKRIDDPEHYMYYHHAYVPPGDCIIIEFSPGDAQTTDKLCESWAAKDWNYQNYEELRETYGDEQ